MQRYSRRVYIGKTCTQNQARLDWKLPIWCCRSRTCRCPQCFLQVKYLTVRLQLIAALRHLHNQLILKAAGIKRSYLFSTSPMWCTFQSAGKRNYICYSMLLSSLSAYCADHQPLHYSDLLHHWTVSSPVLNLGRRKCTTTSSVIALILTNTFKHFENKWSPPPHTFDPCLSCPSVVLYWGNCASECC